MKVYRAVFEYNNCDSNEWEEWYTKTSPWYLNKSLAEQHLPLLRQFQDHLRNYYVGAHAFSCNDPYIEEEEIAESFTPMSLNFMGKDFKGFNYIPYNGPMSICSQKLGLSGFPNPSWRIILTIGEEEFGISYYNYGEGDPFVYKTEQEGSRFYQYNPDTREEMLHIVEKYADSITPYYKKYREDSEALDGWSDLDDCSKREEGWETQRVSEIENIANLLKNSHLKLTNSAISQIKYEIEECGEDGRRGSSPRYKASLMKLLSY